MKRVVRRAIFLAAAALGIALFYRLGERYLWPPPNPDRIDTVGVIEAPEVNLTSRIAGRITMLELLEGDRVAAGQIVCRVEDVDIRNQLARARGDLAGAQADSHLAELTMERDRNLFRHQVISAKERDDAAADLERKRAAVAAARASVEYYTDQLADTVIRSPINGIVVSKALEVGEWVTPGTPILTIDDLSTIWARVDLQETDLGWIRLGSPAKVELPTRPPTVYAGRVMAIGQEGQFATETDVRRGRQDIRTFYVKVRVLNPGGELKPGMTAEVAFVRDNGSQRTGDIRARAD